MRVVKRLKPKLPGSDLLSGLPQFQWNDVTDLVQIGQGSYGVVKFGRYKPSGRQTFKTRDVVLKLPRDINGNEKEFLRPKTSKTKTP